MERKKVITVTVTNDLSFDQRMRRHCQILVNAGYEVLLLGRKKRHSGPLSEEVFQQKRLPCIFQKGKLFYLEYTIRLFFYLLFTRVDILLAVDLDTLLPNTLVAGLRDKKLVFDSHEYYTEVPELLGRPKIKAVWDAIARYAIPRADLAYTVGDALAEELSVRYHYKFHCIKNVPERLVIQPHKVEKREEYLILYQGALNKGRALEPLIDAMQFFDGKLLIVGEGDLSEDLRQRAKDKRLESKITFQGWVKPVDLPSFTAKAWLGYNLLEAESKSYYFSLANKFFDYLHAGLPQLCAPFPEYKKINDSYEVARLVEPNSEAILKTLHELRSNPEMVNKLKINCSLAAEVYNLQNESKKLIQLFQSIPH